MGYQDRGGDTSLASPHLYLYRLWKHVNERCADPRAVGYENYGGRGIQVYPAWREDYMEFKSWILSELGERPTPKHSLDRIENDGHYEPGNLKWATHREQMLGRRITTPTPNLYFNPGSGCWEVRRSGLSKEQAMAYRDAGEAALA